MLFNQWLQAHQFSNHDPENDQITDELVGLWDCGMSRRSPPLWRIPYFHLKTHEILRHPGSSFRLGRTQNNKMILEIIPRNASLFQFLVRSIVQEGSSSNHSSPPCCGLFSCCFRQMLRGTKALAAKRALHYCSKNVRLKRT